MGRYDHYSSLNATTMASKNCPIFGEHVVIVFVTQQVPKQLYDLLKAPLITALGAHNLKTAW